MKNIKKRQWILLAITGVIFIIWAVTIGTVINFSDKLNVDDIVLSNIYKMFANTFIQGTLYAAVFVFFFFSPNLKIFSKNFNGRIDAKLIEMRRDLCACSMLSIMVGFFGMCMMNMALFITNYEFWLEKIGPRELFGIIAMGGVAIACCLYFAKAKQTIALDALSHKNEELLLTNKDAEDKTGVGA